MTYIKGKMQSIKQSLQTICIFDLPFVSRYKQEFSVQHFQQNGGIFTCKHL